MESLFAIDSIWYQYMQGKRWSLPMPWPWPMTHGVRKVYNCIYSISPFACSMHAVSRRRSIFIFGVMSHKKSKIYARINCMHVWFIVANTDECHSIQRFNCYIAKGTITFPLGDSPVHISNEHTLRLSRPSANSPQRRRRRHRLRVRITHS